MNYYLKNLYNSQFPLNFDQTIKYYEIRCNLLKKIFKLLDGDKKNQQKFLEIPDQILISIISFTFVQKIFLNKQIHCKILFCQVKQKVKFICGIKNVSFQNVENPQKANTFQRVQTIKQISALAIAEKRVRYQLFQFKIQKIWSPINHTKIFPNEAFRKFNFLFDFLKNIKMSQNRQCFSKAFEKKQYIHYQNLCCLLCEDFDEVQKQIEIVKEYHQTKVIDSMGISMILNLMKKNIIFFHATKIIEKRIAVKSIFLCISNQQKRNYSKISQRKQYSAQNLEKKQQNSLNDEFIQQIPFIFNQNANIWQVSNSFECFQRKKCLQGLKGQFLDIKGERFQFQELNITKNDDSYA